MNSPASCEHGHLIPGPLGGKSCPECSPKPASEWPPSFYNEFTLAEKLQYTVTCKHYSLEAGCDAHVELFNHLIPQAIKALQENTALLARARREARAEAFQEAARIAVKHALDNGPAHNFEMGGHAIGKKIREAAREGK